MKKVYFAGSIRGGREDAVLYEKIIELLQQMGNEVLTEHIGLGTLTASGEQDKSSTFIYERDLEWLKSADVVVAEVTSPSLGVGYEIAKAEEWGKPVVALFRPVTNRRLSAMIAGSKQVHIIEYETVEDLQVAIPTVLERF